MGAAERAAARNAKKAAALPPKAAPKTTVKAPPKPAAGKNNNNSNNSNNSNSGNNSPPVVPPPKKVVAAKAQGVPKPTAATSTSPRRAIVPLPTPPRLGDEYSDASLAQAKTEMDAAKRAAEGGNVSTKPMLLEIYTTKLGKYENIVAVREKREEMVAYGAALQALVKLDVDPKTGLFKGFTEGQIPKTLLSKMEIFDEDANGNPLYRPRGWADEPSDADVRKWEADVRAAASAADAKYPEAAGMMNPPPGVNVTPAQWKALSKEERQSIWGAHTVGKAHDAANPAEPTWKGLAIQLTGQVVSGALSLGTAYAGHYIEGTGRFAAPAIQTVGVRAAAAVAGVGKGGYRTRRSVKRRSTKTRRTRN